MKAIKILVSIITIHSCYSSCHASALPWAHCVIPAKYAVTCLLCAAH